MRWRERFFISVEKESSVLVTIVGRNSRRAVEVVPRRHTATVEPHTAMIEARTVMVELGSEDYIRIDRIDERLPGLVVLAFEASSPVEDQREH